MREAEAQLAAATWRVGTLEDELRSAGALVQQLEAAATQARRESEESAGESHVLWQTTRLRKGVHSTGGLSSTSCAPWISSPGVAVWLSRP